MIENFICLSLKSMERLTDIILMKPIPMFTKFFHRYLASFRYSIGTVPLVQYLITDIFANILKYFS